MYKRIVKPVLFIFSPDFVHSSILVLGRVAQAVAPMRWAVRRMWRRDDQSLNQQVLGMNLANPIGLSAGFDKNIELVPLMESVGFGFETGGSVTLSPRAGNVKPWFYRLPKTESIVVHAGLANKGIVNIAKSIKHSQKRVKQMPLFISVAVVAKTSRETCQDAIIDAKNFFIYFLSLSL